MKHVVGAIAVVAFVAMFAAQNAQTIQITFLHWSLQGSLVMVLIGAFVAGLLAAWLLALPSGVRTRRELREIRKEVEAMRSNVRDDQVAPS